MTPTIDVVSDESRSDTAKAYGESDSRTERTAVVWGHGAALADGNGETPNFDRAVAYQGRSNGHKTIGPSPSYTESSAAARTRGSTRPPASTVLSAALAALQSVLREPPDAARWQQVARNLRAVTIAERQRSRRHAAIALLLADVLSFTQVEDLREPDRAKSALEFGWHALSQPFISTEVERDAARRLAVAGWQLALPYRGWASGTGQ